MILVGTRALNEELLLPVFLANWPFADVVLIVDGGSEDHSKAIARQDKRVVWYDFPDRVAGKNGGWRNPEGRHMKFLLDRCEELKPDWMFITEIDAFPNLNFQEQIGGILNQCNTDGIRLIASWLCYVAPDGVSHYPKTMQGPGTTAFQPGMATVNLAADMEGQGNMAIAASPACSLPKELSRMHLSWETEEAIQRKRKFYRDVHGWDTPHPDSNYGPREPLPEWAQWKGPRNMSGLGGFGHLRDWS